MVNLAEVLVRTGEKDRARVWYEKALKIRPDSESARQGLEDLRKGDSP